MNNGTIKVGATVVDSKTEEVGTVTAYAKGWFTVALDDMSEVKRREADLELQETEDEEEDEGDTSTMSKKLRHYAVGYVTAINAKGGKTKICGDEVSKTLLPLSLDQIYGTASVFLGATVEALKAKYGHLNLGQQRMNLGNRIRGLVKRMAEEDPKLDVAFMVKNAVKIATTKAA